MEKLELSVRMINNLKRAQFNSIEDAVMYARLHTLEDRRFNQFGRNERKVLNDLLNQTI